MPADSYSFRGILSGYPYSYGGYVCEEYAEKERRRVLDYYLYGSQLNTFKVPLVYSTTTIKENSMDIKTEDRKVKSVTTPNCTFEIEDSKDSTRFALKQLVFGSTKIDPMYLSKSDAKALFYLLADKLFENK